MTVASTRYQPRRPVGDLLREWRQRRRLSQLDLAIQADISARHLSFVETGRSRPTSAMILRLTEHLDVPLRDRNTLLLAGGFAPAYPEHPLDGPELAAVRSALRSVLRGHEPYPAVLVNRWWELLDGNTPVGVLTGSVAAHLLAPPVNVLRLSLHPEGMAPHIVNLSQWRAHLLGRLRRQLAATGDARLAALFEELRGYPGGEPGAPGPADVVVPLLYRLGDQELALFSMTAVVGTPMDVTIEELAIEAFYPADDATARALWARQEG
ncbi:MAG TPA: helix-turn-helix transcriptional regulator [Streptosporangiaceae bacterium]|nr:helix-turn-helix transcriptional regulator [Streptosporangiaceae bacterium]